MEKFTPHTNSQRKEAINSMHKDSLELIIKILKKLKSGEKDFSDINFLSPAGYCIIKTFAESKELNLEEYEFNSNVGGFLKNINFYCNKNKISSTSVLPIHSVTDRGDEENIGNKYIDILNKKITNNENLIKGVQKIIGECLNNIIDHSGDERSQIDGLRYNYNSGQYYKNKEFLQIVICDAGVGILSSLRKKRKDIQNHKDAIKEALKAKVSGGKTLTRDNIEYTQYSNRGIGLTTTLEIIKKLKGDIFIGSGTSLFSYCGKTGEEKYYDIKEYVWTGTFVVINVYSGDDSLAVNINDIESNLLGINNEKNDNEFGIDFG